MQTTDASEYLLKKLRSGQENLKQALVDNPLDIVEVTRLRGEYRGLQYAVEMIEDMVKAVIEGDA